MIYDTIKRKIHNYYAEHGEMPNTVLLPSQIYAVLEGYNKSFKFLQCYEKGKTIKQTILGLDIIEIENESDIKVIKVFNK